MGSFKIEIRATGGHGCDREAQPGMPLQSPVDCDCVDCAARAFVQMYKKTVRHRERDLHALADQHSDRG